MTELGGHYFHTFIPDSEPRLVESQGKVVGEVHPGYYLVELYSWVMGEPYDRRVVSIEDMRGWAFYDDADWMNDQYTRIYKPRAEARSA